MVAPVIIGGAIAAGASLLGGAMGAKSSRRQVEYQREFAQHGVRWRVEDAKRAGVHPLYALGAQVPSFSPVDTSAAGAGLAEAGQHIGGAVAATQTATQRAAEALALQKLQAEIAESDARRNLLLSEAATLNQRAGQSGAFPSEVVDETSSTDTLRGMTEVQAPITPARSRERSDTIAGSIPMWRAVEVAPGRSMVIPGGMQGSVEESLESLGESPLLLAMTVMESEKRYPGFLRWWSDEYVPGLKRARSAWSNTFEEIGSAVRSLRGLDRPKYRTGGSF